MKGKEYKFVPSVTPSAPCPRCGVTGKKVKDETVSALVTKKHKALFRDQYCLCVSPGCPVVYFAGEGLPLYTVDEMSVPVWFKTDSEDTPICYCKGVTRRQIKRAVQSGAHTLKEVKEATGACGGGQCLTHNPGGT